MIQKGTPEKYKAFKYFYLEDMTSEDIAEELHCADRTVWRWVSELTNILCVYLFGADAIILD